MIWLVLKKILVFNVVLASNVKEVLLGIIYLLKLHSKMPDHVHSFFNSTLYEFDPTCSKEIICSVIDVVGVSVFGVRIYIQTSSV